MINYKPVESIPGMSRSSEEAKQILDIVNQFIASDDEYAEIISEDIRDMSADAAKKIGSANQTKVARIIKVNNLTNDVRAIARQVDGFSKVYLAKVN